MIGIVCLNQISAQDFSATDCGAAGVSSYLLSMLLDLNRITAHQLRKTIDPEEPLNFSVCPRVGHCFCVNVIQLAATVSLDLMFRASGRALHGTYIAVCRASVPPHFLLGTFSKGYLQHVADYQHINTGNNHNYVTAVSPPPSCTSTSPWQVQLCIQTTLTITMQCLEHALYNNNELRFSLECT